MTENSNPQVMSWMMIILIMIAVGVVMGVVVGLLSNAFGWSSTAPGVGIGAAMGVVGATLIARRNAALAAQKKKDEG